MKFISYIFPLLIIAIADAKVRQGKAGANYREKNVRKPYGGAYDIWHFNSPSVGRILHSKAGKNASKSGKSILKPTKKTKKPASKPTQRPPTQRPTKRKEKTRRPTPRPTKRKEKTRRPTPRPTKKNQLKPVRPTKGKSLRFGVNQDMLVSNWHTL